MKLAHRRLGARSPKTGGRAIESVEYLELVEFWDNRLNGHVRVELAAIH
jgi:hypothetical protein